MSQVTATGTGGGSNIGVYLDFSSHGRINGSVMNGIPGLRMNNINNRIVNNMIIGGVVDGTPDKQECRGKYDENLVDVDC